MGKPTYSLSKNSMNDDNTMLSTYDIRSNHSVLDISLLRYGDYRLIHL